MSETFSYSYVPKYDLPDEVASQVKSQPASRLVQIEVQVQPPEEEPPTVEVPAIHEVIYRDNAAPLYDAHKAPVMEVAPEEHY